MQNHNNVDGKGTPRDNERVSEHSAGSKNVAENTTYREDECDLNIPDVFPMPSPSAQEAQPAEKTTRDKVHEGQTIAVVPPGASSSFRNGECELNIADVYPAPLDESSLNKLKEIEAGLAGRLGEEFQNEDINPDLKGIKPPHWLHWGFLAALAVMIAVFGFYLFCQIITVVAMTQTLPTWAQLILLPPLAICGLAVLLVFAGFIWSWVKLSKFKQIDINILNDLERLQNTRSDATHHFQNAKRALRAYLGKYPLADDSEKTNGRAAFPIPAQTAKELKAARQRLYDERTDSRRWIEKFAAEFQKPLDQLAKKKVDNYALKAGALTAASPLSLLDSILTLGLSFGMLKELCRLYHLRVSGLGLPVLMARVIKNAFIADQADNLSEAGVNLYNELYKESAAAVGGGLIGLDVLKRVVGAKVAEGTINGLFMRRLGLAAQRLLQPVRTTGKKHHS